MSRLWRVTFLQKGTLKIQHFNQVCTVFHYVYRHYLLIVCITCSRVITDLVTKVSCLCKRLFLISSKCYFLSHILGLLPAMTTFFRLTSVTCSGCIATANERTANLGPHTTPTRQLSNFAQRRQQVDFALTQWSQFLDYFLRSCGIIYDSFAQPEYKVIKGS